MPRQQIDLSHCMVEETKLGTTPPPREPSISNKTCSEFISTQTNEIFVETKSAQSRKDILIDKNIQTQPSADDSGEILRKVECNEFEKHKCFYCEKEIKTELHLLEHRESCQGAGGTPSLFSFPVRPKPLLFKSGICGLVASYKEDIVTHKKHEHDNQ